MFFLLNATRSTKGFRMYIMSRITDGRGKVWGGEGITRGEGSTVSALPLRRRVIARRALVKWSGSKLPFSTSTATSSKCGRMIRRGGPPCQPRDHHAPRGRLPLSCPSGTGKVREEEPQVGGPL